MHPLFAIPTLGTGTLLILVIFGILFFGRRLPELGRNLGKGILEFKKGVKGLEDEEAGETPPQVEQAKPARPASPTVPKFNDPPR